MLNLSKTNGSLIRQNEQFFIINSSLILHTSVQSDENGDFS